MSLLTSAPANAANAFHRLTDYLRRPQIQQQIMRVTHRRPIVGGVPLSAELAAHQPYDLPFPRSLATVNDLIATYSNALRRPGRTIYVLDTSGSMATQERLAHLEQALLALTGADPSLVGQFSQLQEGEQLTFIPFNAAPDAPTTFTIPVTSPQPLLQQINSYIRSLRAGGNTAIYDSLVEAYHLMAQQHAADPDRIESIVLLTDGENNTGRDLAGFTAFYHQLPPGQPPIFSILFGEARKDELDALATLTDGVTFDALANPLTDIFEQIRAYQ
jgi:Ca-activated chloride channel family protein